MVKGTCRQIVMVQTFESDIFEVAYFVLKSGEGVRSDEKSMIDEANRIVSDACCTGVDKKEKVKKKDKRYRGKRIFFFMLGILLGGGIVGAFMGLMELF